MHQFRHRPWSFVTSILFAALLAACGGGGGDPVSNPITISVSPTTASVNAGATQTFTATMTNATNNAVTWSASGGTIQGSGTSATWTAPLSGGPFTITATSDQDPTKSASATATVKAVTVSISPSPATVAAGGTQEFTATVGNSANTGVTWTTNGGTIAGTGNTITWTAPTAGGSYSATATSSADPTKSATVNITVTPVVVAIDPESPTVGAGGTQTFTATVTGASDDDVAWTSTGGTITGTGATVTWTAPVTGGTFDVTATSVLDPGSSATATVIVTPINVSIAPTAPSLFRGEATTFTATVTGAAAGLDAVTWTSTCGAATPDGATLAYVAPAAGGTCTITATSVSDASRSASTTVTVRTETLVTAADDADDGACNFAHCSLREAIVAANATQAADVILLSPAATVPPPPAPMFARRAVSRRAASNAMAVTGTITLTSPLPDITTPMTIAGPGPEQLTLHANASLAALRRLFTVTGQVQVTIAGMTLRGGMHGSGGAILVQSGGNLSLADVVITDNQALSGVGGGIRVFGASTLRLENVVLDANRTMSAAGSGGAIAANGSVVTVVGGAIRNNVSMGTFGAGIYSTSSTVNIDGTAIAGNSGADGGGGIAAWDGGSLSVVGGATISDNTVDQVGGGILAGAGSFAASARVTVHLDNVVIDGNTASLQGGGIQFTRNAAATLDRVIVTANTTTEIPAGFPTIGGGVMIGGSSNVEISNSTIANNVLAPANPDQSQNGGAGLAQVGEDENITLMLRNSTISGNRMNGTNSGGGIYIGEGTAEVINSTVSGNTATRGGGVMTEDPVTLRNVTIVGNVATVEGGGIRTDDDELTLSSVILAGNVVGTDNPVPSNCAVADEGVVVSEGYNLSDDATCAALDKQTDKTNTPAGINPTLADNGGPTRTHALLTGSAAIDAGNPATCPATDQRGVARQGTCDIGAFEFVAAGTSFRSLMAPGAMQTRRALRTVLRATGIPARAPAVEVVNTGLGLASRGR